MHAGIYLRVMHCSGDALDGDGRKPVVCSPGVGKPDLVVMFGEGVVVVVDADLCQHLLCVNLVFCVDPKDFGKRRVVYFKHGS